MRSMTLACQRLPEVPLLHRGQHRIDNDEPDCVFRDHRAADLDVPGTEQGRRYGAWQSDCLSADNLQVDGARQSDRFFEMRLKRALWRLRLQVGMDLIAG